jgi:hypothetical protein
MNTRQIPLIALFLGLTTLAFAQNPSVNGYWEGSWNGSIPFNVALLTDEGGTKVTGTITWIFEEYTGEADGSTKRVLSKEMLEGTYDAKTGVLKMQTVAEDDAAGLLVPGYYYMKMEASGATMSGFTRNNGSSYNNAMRMSRLGV